MPGIISGYMSELDSLSLLITDAWWAAKEAVAFVSAPPVDVSVHIVGGNGMPPIAYAGLQGYLQNRAINSPNVHLPRKTLRFVRDIPAYLDDVGTATEREIWIGHSLGGYVALKRLCDAPERVESVIIMGTPLHASWMPPTVKASLKWLVGIDLETFPGCLACLPTIQASAALRDKVTIILARRDRFIPREGYLFDGVRSHEADCTHLGLLCSPSAFERIRSVVEGA